METTTNRTGSKNATVSKMEIVQNKKTALAVERGLTCERLSLERGIKLGK